MAREVTLSCVQALSPLSLTNQMLQVPAVFAVTIPCALTVAICSLSLSHTPSASMPAGSVISELEMQMNENYLITYTKTSAKADERPVWHSADESIAAVDQNGFVYAVAAGDTTIFVSLKNGKTYAVALHVNAADITLKAHSGTAATLTFNNVIGTSQTFAVNGDFLKEDFACGTYMAVLTAPHHTKLTVEDAAIFRDVDLGELMIYNGDANGDGVVDIADISLLLQAGHYGASAAQAGTELDINDNGTIEIGDIAEILSAANYGGTDTTILF